MMKIMNFATIVVSWLFGMTLNDNGSDCCCQLGEKLSIDGLMMKGTRKWKYIEF